MAVALSGSIVLAGSITGSLLGTASYSSNTEFFDGLDSSVFALTSSLGSFTSSLNDFSSSINTYTASNNANIAALNAATASLYNATASLYGATSSLFTYSASATSRINALDQYTASLNTRSASFACVTATNNFACVQYFSNASNAVSFTSTGSLYSDGGMRLTKDLYVSGTSYFNNVTIFGTQSVNYITSSQLNIASNIITVNTATPTVRFGGLAVYDSGSLGTGLTGSILWDSEDNQWIYSNPSGSTYDSALFLVGPRNSGVLGGEAGISCNFLSKGNGMHHMTSSGIFEDGSRTCFYGQSFISSSGNACFSGQVCSNTVSTTDGTNTSTLANNYLRYNGGDFYVDACAVGGNFRIRTSNTTALDSTALFICGKNSNVGIGTTTPAYKLDVNGSFSFTTGGNYLQYNSGILYHGNYYQYPSGNDYLLFARTSGGLNFGTNDTQRLSISSTGIASFTCQICTVAAVTADLRYTGTGFITYDTSVSGTSCLIVRQDATERIRFNGAGCISVGTTCTLGRLTVASEAGTSGITLLNTTAAVLGTETQFITWEGLTNGGGLQGCPLGRIGVVNVNGGTSIGSMVFHTKQFNAGICERMRITSDGSVGIGTTSPDIFGRGDGFDVGISSAGISSTQNMSLQLNAGATAGRGAQIYMGQGGTRHFTISSNVTESTIGTTSNTPLRFVTCDSLERLRITAAGIVCFACQVCSGVGFYASSLQSGITIDSTTNGDTIIASRGLSSALHGIVRTVGQNGVTCAMLISTRDSVDGNLPASVNALWGLTNHAMVIATNNAERMRITSGGCVIINGTSASSIMTIYPAAGSADTLTYRTTGNAAAGALYAYSDGNGPSSGILHNVSITSGGAANRFNGSFSGWTIAFDSRPASDTMTFNYVNTSGTYITRISLAGNGITCFGCAVSIGAASTSTEANLFLGGLSSTEGGQLVLQKATSFQCASHIDNYSNQFRILSGTDTGTTAAHMIIDHTTKNACFYGAVTSTSRVIGNGFRSYSGEISIASGATSTIYTMADNGLYTVQAIVAGGSLIYSAAAIFYAHNSNAQYVKTTDLYDGANVTLDNSGSSIRITNGGFTTLTWNWSIIFQAF